MRAVLPPWAVAAALVLAAAAPWTMGCDIEGRLSIRIDLDAGVGTVSDGAARDGRQDVADGADGGVSTKVVLNVIQVNLGNLDQSNGGPCPAYHMGTQCERKVEAEFGSFFFGKGIWDIVVLNNVWDSDRCKGQSVGDAKLVCYDYTASIPYQQVRRLLGNNYTIVCDNLIHFDCIAVRATTVVGGYPLVVQSCPLRSLCFSNFFTLSLPAACAGVPGVGSLSGVTVDVHKLTMAPWHAELKVFNLHAFRGSISGGSDDPAAVACRLAQYKDLFLQPTPSVGRWRTLIVGDIGSDHRKHGGNADSAYWSGWVGPGLQFDYHSPTTPTRMSDKAATDVVVSNFLGGAPCTVHDEASGPFPSFWHRFDHRPVLCSGLSFDPEATFCGDLACEDTKGETCKSCPKDCGPCP